MSDVTYQSPVTAYDTADADGIRAQVKLERGTLPVAVIEPVKSMMRVEFDIAALGNPKLTRNPYGLINPTEPAFAVLQAAHQSGEPVAFRIEARRRPHRTSRRVAMADLSPKDDTVRCLVAAADTFTSEALTDPAEDIRWHASPDAPAFIDTRPTSGIDTERLQQARADLAASLASHPGIDAADATAHLAVFDAIAHALDG